MSGNRRPEYLYSSERVVNSSRDRSDARIQIEADTLAFMRAGGSIQVLPNTPLRRKDGGNDPATLNPPELPRSKAQGPLRGGCE